MRNIPYQTIGVNLTQIMASGGLSAPNSQVGPSQRVVLRGGFSPITGLTFRGQNEEKGKKIAINLFNVEEIQVPGENTVITAKILRSTSINEHWLLRFELNSSREVIKSWCGCYVGESAICKHGAALFLKINEERPEGKTDDEQKWQNPSQKMLVS